ncbi:MAG: sugar phosphate nucleotidyltransferase [Planctomycetota bacterium]
MTDERETGLQAVLLAAGYSTRLRPLTENQPKSLLTLGGRPIMDYVMEGLADVPQIEGYTVVTNAKFHDHFVEWAENREFDRPLEILNDGTTSNENRLGALADVQFVMQNSERARSADGIYLAATDNVPPFDLSGIAELSDRKGGSAVFACRTDDRERLERSGVARLDDEDRIVEFEEKPDEPQSNLVVPPFYVYVPEALSLLDDYLEGDNDPDAPGNFLGWLIDRHTVWARPVERPPRDIGTVDSYRRAQRDFDSA